MIEERIFFRFTIDIPDIDKFEHDAQTSAGEHLGELVLGNASSDILLKIFYDPAERLDRKIMGRDGEYSATLLSKFKVTSVESPYENLTQIDFCEYDFMGMEASTQFNESGLDYFTIRPTGIKLIYKAENQKDSEFYLNKTAFNLIELNYKYHYNLPWNNDSFKWEPTNKVKAPINFNKIEFIPEHRFSTIKHDNDLSIIKEPRIRLKHEDLKEHEVKAHADLICALYSFYSNKEITWRESKIYAEGKLFYEIKRVPEEDKRILGLFFFDFFQNPLNLITNVNAAFLFEKQSLVCKMIERYNYSLQLRDEPKFMILYGLLEQLRNQYIEEELIEREAKGNPNRAKEVYDFNLKPKDVEKAIQKAIESLVDIVAAEQQEMFKQDIKHKMLGIRLLSMSNQFQSYFDYLKLDPIQFKIDFSELKMLRDRIFHGRKTDDLREVLQKAIWYEHLPRFTGILLLKFFGIGELSEIKNKRY